MAKFRVIVVETQYYEVYVEADTEDKANDIACDSYRVEGVIFSEGITIASTEEEEE